MRSNIIDVENSTDIKSAREMSFMGFSVEYRCVIIQITPCLNIQQILHWKMANEDVYVLKLGGQCILIT